MQTMTNEAQSCFRSALKSWRSLRKMSQLDLALTAGVSQRHLSWLETGRSKPSREMILRLSEAMELPFRDRNTILNLAGFAKIYTEQSLDEPAMSAVQGILKDMLEHHEPYPVIVFDRYWNIKMKNATATALFDLTIGSAFSPDKEQNIALLSVHPDGLRQYISNWDQIAPAFLRRLKKEAIESGDDELMARYQELENLAGDVDINDLNGDLIPILPLELRFADLDLSLCSVISTLGTAQDITANELRIEAFYPGDQTTRDFFKQRIESS